MLKNLNSNRKLKENIQLGGLTAFSAGMVNVTSVIIFFAFTSNVTGHYAILAQEIAKGNWYQASIVLIWIFLFLLGSFTSNFCIINARDSYTTYLAHAIPLVLEIGCLLTVGIYLQGFYTETLRETEFLVGLMLFAMGLQNGLTASISNGAVKTTHLTGLTTDLGLTLSMLTKRKNRESTLVKGKAQLLFTIMLSYMAGGILAGVVYLQLKYYVFFAVCIVLIIVIIYDYSKLNMRLFIRRKHSYWKSKRVNVGKTASESC